jgi:predicted SAM-dependent methyltransferase
MPRADIAIVFATYNRRSHLEKAVASIRRTLGKLTADIIVVDGGSTDGSRAWLAEQPDVHLIADRGPLDGAVRAFNLGFRHAMERGHEYIGHLNDDAECLDVGMWQRARDKMKADQTVGGVAFAFDLRGSFKHETVHGVVYSNFGLLRTKAMKQVARAHGDPSSTKVWNPIYRTYGADSEVGCWMSKLGWKIAAHPDRVHDLNVQDPLRTKNTVGQTDSKKFWERWEKKVSIQPPTSIAWKPGTKIHLGCGTHRLAGWMNLDGVAGPAVDHVIDIEKDLQAIPAGIAPLIYWSHGPEHIHPDQLGQVLAHLHRILTPDGVLLLAAPDLVGIYNNRYLEPNNGPHWQSAMFGETNSSNHRFAMHKQIFTAQTLAEAVLSGGFATAESWRLDEYQEIWDLNDYARSCALVTTFVRGRK